MKTVDLSRLRAVLSKNKFIIPLLLLGLLLLLMPSSGSGGVGRGSELASSGIPMDTESARIADFLSSLEGVGECRVLLSAEGAVVACDGALQPGVKLCVINAVSAYTGLGSDKISVIKLK